MPRATVTVAMQEFDLKTVPGGTVTVRRMTYGEKLQRQDELMSLSAIKDGDDMSLNMQMLNKKAALADFKNLVVSHNLTDEDDRPLNFANAADVMRLDPRVGDEIGELIDKINAYEGELKN